MVKPPQSTDDQLASLAEVARVYADAVKGLPVGLFKLGPTVSDGEANKILYKRIGQLSYTGLFDLVMIANSCLHEKSLDLKPEDIEMSFPLYGDSTSKVFLDLPSEINQYEADQELRSRLNKLTKLELVTLIANANGRIGSNLIEEVLDAPN